MKTNKHLYPWAIKQSYHANPKNFILYNACFLLNSLLFPLTIFLREQLFSSALSEMRWKEIPLWLLVMILSNILTGFLSSYGNYYAELHDFFSTVFLQKKVMSRSAELSGENWEDASFLDTFHRVEHGVKDFTGYVNISLDLLTVFTVQIISLIVYLAMHSLWLPLIVLLVMIPLPLKMYYEKAGYGELGQKETPFSRKFERYSNTLLSASGFKEILTTGLTPYFLQELSKLQITIQSMHRKEWDRQAKIKLLISSLSLLSYFGAVLFLVFLVLKQDITVGLFAALFFAMDELYSLAGETFSARFSGMAKAAAHITVLQAFLRADIPSLEKNARTEKEAAKDDYITLDSVSYSYPGSEKKALDNVSIRLNRKEHTALVGLNGSGKSTLAKLLLGVYSPTAGVIFGAGMYDKSVHLQNFGKYEIDAADNVMLSDWQEQCPERAEASLQSFSFPMDKLSNGLHTLLGREFGEMELSGGEWQRIALARAMYRGRDFLIFDEPTSSIDPLEEQKIFQAIEFLSEDKGLLLITHRLAMLPHMDRILLLQDGKIIADGTHESLLVQSEIYLALWEGQSKRYRTDAVIE